MNTLNQPLGAAVVPTPSIMEIIRSAVSSGLQVHSYRDAAELLGVSRSTIRNMVKSGQLKQVLIGRTNKITHDSLTALFNGGL